MNKDTIVLYTRAYEGPIHQLCYNAWRKVSQHPPTAARARVVEVPNKAGLDHYQMLASMWEAARASGERYVILTEADFLPDLTMDWIQAAIHEMGECVALTPRHCEWMGTSWEPIQTGTGCGASFILFDTSQLPVDFTPEWRHENHDPGVMLNRQIHVARVTGQDVHFSMRYAFGTHLFWSRVYNEEPFLYEDGKLKLQYHQTYPIYCLQAACVAMLRRWEVASHV